MGRHVRSLSVALAVGALALCVAAAAGGSINDVEHVVIWMQENRAFDHYYGTLRGVRGFNDRAAPPLPNGRPVWYQPAGPPPNKTKELCGCEPCHIEWTAAGEQAKGLVLGMQCPTLAFLLEGAQPPTIIKNGMQCIDLINRLRNTTLQHVHLDKYFSAGSTCPPGTVVDGLPSGFPDVAAEDADGADTDDDHYILPFNLQFDKTSAQCMAAPEMAYESDINIFNSGRMDAWNTARAPGFGMAYFNRTDLPYYYALADAFTVGDQYFQSTFTATNPNRQHLFSGSNGLSVPDSGYCQLDDSEPKPGFPWETMAQTLQNANITWQVIQEKDNFDDNAFAWFAAFNKTKPGEPLWDHGMADVPDLVKAFSDQVSSNTLPQVTWIVGPTALSEHATNHPGDGEDLSHRLINVLAQPENADVYAKTVFILNYDEGGQFFDHHWTPVPPVNASDGKSTVTTVGELTLKPEFGIPAGNPIGLGFRVPLFIISPWTRGDYTYSEVSDHTSVIKFIEKRFGVHCPNISPWRRAVTGDLTPAFDWDAPDYSWPANMPSTADNVNKSKAECEHLPAPTLPTVQHLATQEPGTRKARALPYAFDISDSVAADGSVTVIMNNTGTATAVFFVYNFEAPLAAPKKYTVEGGKMLDDTWDAITGKYNLSLHGPNGFVRQFAGDAPTVHPAVSAHLRYVPAIDTVHVVVSAPAAAMESCTFTATDNAYGAGGPWHLAPSAAPVDMTDRKTLVLEVPTRDSGNWYDLTVVATGCGHQFRRRFMGHMETGRTTITDPAMGMPVAGIESVPHPPIPESHRVARKWDPVKDCLSNRSRRKDECWGFGAEIPQHTEL